MFIFIFFFISLTYLKLGLGPLVHPWNPLSIPSEELEEVAEHRAVWASLLSYLNPDKWLDGWVNGYKLYTWNSLFETVFMFMNT